MSRRTIFRDLETIEAAGLPVEYDATRQGYCLAAGGPGPPPAAGGARGARAGGPGQRRGRPRRLRPGRAGAGGAAQARSRGCPEESRRRAEAVDLATRPESPAPPARSRRRLVHERLLEALAPRGPRPAGRPRARPGPRDDAAGPVPDVPGERGLVGGRAVVAPSAGPAVPAGVGRVGRADRRAGGGPAAVPGRPLARPDVVGRAGAGPVRGPPPVRRRGGPGDPRRPLARLAAGRDPARRPGRPPAQLDRPEDLAPWVLGQGEHVEVLAPARLRRAVRRLAGGSLAGTPGRRRVGRVDERIRGAGWLTPPDRALEYDLRPDARLTGV